MIWKDDCFDGNLIPFIFQLHVTILRKGEPYVVILIHPSSNLMPSLNTRSTTSLAYYVRIKSLLYLQECDMGPNKQAMRHFCSFSISKPSSIGTIFVFAKMINISGSLIETWDWPVHFRITGGKCSVERSSGRRFLLAIRSSSLQSWMILSIICTSRMVTAVALKLSTLIVCFTKVSRARLCPTTHWIAI